MRRAEPSARECAGATAVVGWSIDYIAPLEAEDSGRRPRFFVRMWREKTGNSSEPCVTVHALRKRSVNRLGKS